MAAARISAVINVQLRIIPVYVLHGVIWLFSSRTILILYTSVIWYKCMSQGRFSSKINRAIWGFYHQCLTKSPVDSLMIYLHTNYRSLPCRRKWFPLLKQNRGWPLHVLRPMLKDNIKDILLFACQKNHRKWWVRRYY